MTKAAMPTLSQSRLEQVSLRSSDAGRLLDVLESDAADALCAAGERAAELLSGRRLWQINSNAASGGVAELLSWFLPLAAAAGIDVRWLALDAPEGFFELTKRIHHLLHENERELRPDDRQRYEAWLQEAAERVVKKVQPGDVVVVHDPQPAGLVPALVASGAIVVWRCHVGTDHPGPEARKAIEFITPYVREAGGFVFSRDSFAWDSLDAARVRVIQPAIDPLAPKNQELAPRAVDAILTAIGLCRGEPEHGEPVFVRADTSEGRVVRRARIEQEFPVPLQAPIVSQVSRWDPLKDPEGVIGMFAEHVPAGLGAHLVLAGPRVTAVEDDPEGERVLAAVSRYRSSLPDAIRSRVHVVSLPMDDVEENAAMVNAIQRASTIVVQKSLHEGFGLTVVEAMWKGRPIVASGVGGIREQIQDGVSGVLLDDPRDLAAAGAAVTRLLRDPDLRERLGVEARRAVIRDFLPDRPAKQWLDVLETVVATA
jgi:trehalose synthase